MVNHDLARLTMIVASVPWLRTLGREQLDENIKYVSFKITWSVVSQFHKMHNKNTEKFRTIHLIHKQTVKGGVNNQFI